MVMLASPVFAQPLPGLSCTDVEADKSQPAGASILIRITVTNTGSTPISYWCGGPGQYPGAHHFSAHVTDEKGNTRKAALDNGQYLMGSGTNVQIQPGQSVTLPAALAPLPAGSYSIQVGDGKPAKLIVKDDPQLDRAREKDLVARIRLGEPFAQHVAGRFPTESVTRALIQELLSKDHQAALRASQALENLKKMPSECGATIAKAMRMRLTAEEIIIDHQYLLDSLAVVAANVGTDEALSAVLTLIHSSRGRWAAVAQLGRFKQEEATKALRGILKDNNEDKQFEAARALANRKDPAALDVLLEVAGNKTSRWRTHAYLALTNFPKDPRVEPALKNGLKDTNGYFRSEIEKTLQQLQRAREKPPEKR
jgi:hypothetical protein